MEEKEKHELLDRRVSEWLDGDSICGDSSYLAAHTNLEWCVIYVDRLLSKGVRAGVVRHLGKVAVFRLNDGESTEDVARKLLEADAA